MADGPARFESVRIAAFTTLAAILYGILHDLVTAHLCIEYFTIAHPPVFPTRSPLLLALGWGILAAAARPPASPLRVAACAWGGGWG